jgi:hypothetical protein
MRKYILILISFFLIQIVFGQDSTLVKTYQTQTEVIKKSLRLGLGVQHNLYSELGFARHKTTTSCTGYFSSGYYSALEWSPKTANYKDIYALKAGYEIATMLGSIGLETKYQTNFDTKNFVITPKIGFGLVGDVFLFYGYAISTNHNPFPNLGRHQFSIVFNLNKHFLK